MKKRVLLLGCVLLAVMTIVPAVAAQKGFNGNWEWQSAPNKQKEQTAVWVDIKQKGNKATGSIWFNQLIGGDADGTDASHVPFVGTISGDTLTIEFDTTDIYSIDDENVRYRKPRGRQPETAVLKLKNGRLQWTQTRGAFDVGLTIPKQMTLRRTT